jgi:hypothetical protein
MGRISKKAWVLRIGILYRLDGRCAPFPIYEHIKSRKWAGKHEKRIEPGEWALLVLGEERMYGHTFVKVAAFNQRPDNDTVVTGFLLKEKFLNVVVGKPKMDFIG